jgi:hypothetical protein
MILIDETFTVFMKEIEDEESYKIHVVKSIVAKK